MDSHNLFDRSRIIPSSTGFTNLPLLDGKGIHVLGKCDWATRHATPN